MHSHKPLLNSTFDSAHLLRPKVPGSVGLLSKIFSMSSMISGVIFGSSCRHLTLSSIWATLVAPRMTVETFSFLMVHAKLSCATLPPSFSAIYAWISILI